MLADAVVAAAGSTADGSSCAWTEKRMEAPRRAASRRHCAGVCGDVGSATEARSLERRRESMVTVGGVGDVERRGGLVAAQQEIEAQLVQTL